MTKTSARIGLAALGLLVACAHGGGEWNYPAPNRAACNVPEAEPAGDDSDGVIGVVMTNPLKDVLALKALSRRWPRSCAWAEQVLACYGTVSQSGVQEEFRRLEMEAKQYWRGCKYNPDGGPAPR